MDNKDQYYEYIVVGCGGIGSGTLYWLSKLSKDGKNVLRLIAWLINSQTNDHAYF